MCVVTNGCLVLFFCTWLCNFAGIIYCRGFFFSIVHFWPLSKKLFNHIYVGLFWVFKFYCIGFCVCFFFSQCHAVWIIIVLWYNLKPGVWYPQSCSSILRIVLAISALLWFPTYLIIFYSVSFKNSIGIVLGIALNLCIALGNINILAMLTLPMHKHGTSFHLIMSSLIFF